MNGEVDGSLSSSTFCLRLCRRSATAGLPPLAPAPSMKTRPARPFAPGLPWKSQVAYAVVIEPPSEWPPMTTVRPCFFAFLTTFLVSWTATFMPQFLAYSVSVRRLRREVRRDRASP